MGQTKGKKAAGASETFFEQERKLNAANGDELDLLRAYVIKNPHYAMLNEARFIPSLLQGLPLRVPQEDSGPRFRVYFDNAALTATRSEVELRIEQRRSKNGEGWACKQVVKIGHAGSEKNPTLRRMEHTATIQQLEPQLQAVAGEGGDFLKDVFNARGLNKVRLYPLIAIASQRWKTLYHPGGNPDVQIEIATDTGRGRTLDGFTWDIFQVEIELKKGDPRALESEMARLGRDLRFLTPEIRSKPSPGFDHLIPLLDEKKNREKVRNLHPQRDGVFRELKF